MELYFWISICITSLLGCNFIAYTQFNKLLANSLMSWSFVSCMIIQYNMVTMWSLQPTEFLKNFLMLLYILSMSCFIIDQLVHSLFQTFHSYLKKRRWKTKGLLSIEGNCSAKYFTYYQEGRKEIGSKKNNGSNVQFNTIR